MLKAVELSVSIGVGGCLWTISLSVLDSGIVVFPPCKRAPSQASAADATTLRSTWNLVWSRPLFIEFLGCLDGSDDIELKKNDHPLCFVFWLTEVGIISDYM